MKFNRTLALPWANPRAFFPFSSQGFWRFFLICSGWLIGCKQELDEKPASPPPTSFEQPDVFFVTSIVGNETDLGMIINDPISGIQYAASGPKNDQGKLDSVLFIIETEPATGGWLAHEFNEDYTPSKTTTSTGQTIEYTELDPITKTGSAKVSDTNSGQVIWEGQRIKLNDSFFDNIGEARAKSTEIKKNRNVSGAEMLYLLTSAAGCGMGILGLSMGPLALPWGLYNTYQNCKSAKEAAENLYNGKPAFGCITTKDNANAISGFAETISQGGGFGNLATGLLPALVNYGAQHAGAGQCNDSDDPNNPNDPNDPGNGDDPYGDGKDLWEDLGDALGRAFGDPHLSTPDGLLYDFHGWGEFVLTQSTVDNFEVQVRLGNPLRRTLASYHVHRCGRPHGRRRGELRGKGP